MPIHKYKKFNPIDIQNRLWPSNIIEKSPIWCSVDLRDGNQALIEPMGLERKMRMFNCLLEMGYKEIEIGFPSASQTDFQFARHLIENNLIPDDVVIQVLVQCREHLISRTFEAIDGAKKAIIHFYNSTSTLQRRVVFNASQEEVKNIAVQGAAFIMDLSKKMKNTHLRYQYSPESFTQTELDFALETCHAVMDVIKPTQENKIIFNLPATVEIATPNHYADQIEWMNQNFKDRENIILSLHPHNDRGTGVAAAELGIMAGADRIEGTLFGNGERTGNVDLVTLGMNMVSQGVDAGIDFSDMRKLVSVAEHCNRLPVGERHPYAGSLVFTAFSGSHQDAIKKGLKAMGKSNSGTWEVPYLPIDPSDVGASYEEVIRINSQSGKGGIAYILESDYQLRLPRRLQIEFSQIVQEVTDEEEIEILPENLFSLFNESFVNIEKPYRYIDHQTVHLANSSDRKRVRVTLEHKNKQCDFIEEGSGPIEGLVKILNKQTNLQCEVMDYSEHAVGKGADAEAVSYIELKLKGKTLHGAGRHKSISTASLIAVISAYNRFLKKKK